MGGFSSKQAVAEVTVPNKQQIKAETPKRPKVLPFDPRSPSECISRTPIAVTNSDSLTNSTPAANGKVEVLKQDPRSPSVEIMRTPIEIEGKLKNKHQPFKPSKLATVSTDIMSELEECDPRSPTEKVPRTPLEESNYDDILSSKQTIENGILNAKNKEVTDSLDLKENSINNSNNKQDASINNSNSPRVPLADIQNLSINEQSNIDEKSCIQVEEEYSKIQENLLNQLDAPKEKTISTATQFIEDI